MRLQGVVRQSRAEKCLNSVISNYSEVEYAFCHTDLNYFATRRPISSPSLLGFHNSPLPTCISRQADMQEGNHNWSVLLPICSCKVIELLPPDKGFSNGDGGVLHRNRFGYLEQFAQHITCNQDSELKCWERLSCFVFSFKDTALYQDKSEQKSL